MLLPRCPSHPTKRGRRIEEPQEQEGFSFFSFLNHLVCEDTFRRGMYFIEAQSDHFLIQAGGMLFGMVLPYIIGGAK